MAKRGRPPKKRVSILCPGKSLSSHKGPFEGKVIAVTDAIFHEVPCDVWCYRESPKSKRQGRYRVYGDRCKEINPVVWGARGSRDRWLIWRWPGSTFWMTWT